MNEREPFTPSDLADLDTLLSRAHAVISMREVHAGNRHADVIALRHDVDGMSIGAEQALATAIHFAEWEAERGYRSTFYLLPSSPYWRRKDELRQGVQWIAELGHEVGIHANALADSLRTGRDPAVILREALDELRSFGAPIRSVVGHGDPLCRTVGFANDEMFIECARPKEGEPDRVLTHEGQHLRIKPRSLAEYGLDFEAVRLGRGYVNSDSGGRWLFPFEDTIAEFDGALIGAAAGWKRGQLHLLVHPDWWSEAFA